MSRAFVKEDDQADNAEPIRPRSPHTNYVTPQGLRQLEAQVRALIAERELVLGHDDLSSQQAKTRLERDIAYYADRVKHAVRVDPESQPMDKVHFGARVDVEDEEGEQSSSWAKMKPMQPMARSVGCPRSPRLC